MNYSLFTFGSNDTVDQIKERNTHSDGFSKQGTTEVNKAYKAVYEEKNIKTGSKSVVR